MAETFAAYLATGKGRVAFRLVIEGCPYEFVSDAAMQGAIGDGRYRVNGLQESGIQITESVNMAQAELNVQLSSLQITETVSPYLDAATSTFTGWTAGCVKTYLAPGYDVGASDTTGIPVKSAAALSIDDYVHVGTEVWKITGVTLLGVVGTPDTIDVERAQWRTTMQAFPSTSREAGGLTPTVYELSSQPGLYRGRRVWLYGHGADELDVSDTGEMLFRGILGENPELTDTGTWSLSLQPRTALLDAQIGVGTAGTSHIRGIYYPGKGPLALFFYRMSGATNDAIPVSTATVVFVGFYETQAAFCSALLAAINANSTIAGWNGTWDVRQRTGGGWDLVYHTDAVDERYVEVMGGSACDGWFTGGLAPLVDIGSLGPRGFGDSSVYTVAADTEYFCGFTVGGAAYAPAMVPVDQLRAVPRASYQASDVIRGSDAQIASYPLARFYLDTIAGFGDADFLVTPPRADGSSDDADPIAFTGDASSIAGYVQSTRDDLIERVLTGGAPGFACAGTFQPDISLAVRYGSPDGCTLWAFIQAVIAEAPNSANLGVTPWLLNDDVADWTSEVIIASTGKPWLARRDYVFAKARKLSDVLREELKLHGMFLRLDSEGKIDARRFPQVGSTTPSTAIDADSHLPGDDFGTERIAPDGLITSVNLKLGYLSDEDKWQTEWQFKNASGAATAKNKGQALDIAPVVRSRGSAPFESDGMTASDADEIVQHVQGWFGRQYYVISVPVAITKHTLRLGDACLVTVPQLPHAGARGMNTSGAGLYQTRATVVGRSWAYGDDLAGTLDLFVHGLDTAGYAPSALVTSASGGGVSWALTCFPQAYGDGSVDDAAYFAAGYKIVLREYDSDAPIRITGTVVSVASDVVNVTLDAPWLGMGASSYILGFGAAQDVVAAQRSYVFLADPTGRIVYSTTSAAPRVFS